MGQLVNYEFDCSNTIVDGSFLLNIDSLSYQEPSISAPTQPYGLVFHFFETGEYNQPTWVLAEAIEK